MLIHSLSIQLTVTENNFFFKPYSLQSELLENKPKYTLSTSPESKITLLFLNTENIKGPYEWRVVASMRFLLCYSFDVLLKSLWDKQLSAILWISFINNSNSFIHSANIWVSTKCVRASLITQLVKNLPAVQETLVWFLGQKDPLENG